MPSTTLSSNTFTKQQNVTFRIKPVVAEVPDVAMETYIANLQIPEYNSLDAEGKAQHMEKFDALELFVVVQDVKRELAVVKLENHFLTDFLEKNDPKLLIGLRQRRNTASMRQQQRLTISSPAASPHSSTANVRTSGSRRSEVGRSHSSMTIGSVGGSGRKANFEFRLNYKAKSDMAEKAAADVERKIRKFEDSAMKEIRLLNATMEELRNRTEETEETAKNFKLHFVSDQRDLFFLETATEKQIERKFRKFVENWLKNARALLGTMRLSITTIQENCQVQRSMLLTKADLSGILGAIDFEQLQIKRGEYQKSLDEKNAYMAGLKGVSGRASLSMAEEKQEMMSYENKLQAISNKTSDVIRAISKLEKEACYIEDENNKDEKTLVQLKDQLDQYDAPSVSEYIERKDELVLLEKEDKMLQRKIFILNMKLTNLLRKNRRWSTDYEKDENQ